MDPILDDTTIAAALNLADAAVVSAEKANSCIALLTNTFIPAYYTLPGEKQIDVAMLITDLLALYLPTIAPTLTASAAYDALAKAVDLTTVYIVNSDFSSDTYTARVGRSIQVVSAGIVTLVQSQVATDVINYSVLVQKVIRPTMNYVARLNAGQSS